MDVLRVTSGPQGLFSNTYIVAAPHGSVVVDPPMLLSDARVVRNTLTTLDRPLAAFIYTHPHPDHVNGATEIRGEREVPVFATAETARISREIDDGKREFWTAIFPDDYPPVTTFPDHVVGDGDVVDVAGLSFRVRDIGPGECATASLWLTGRVAFVGDLVYSHAHPWLFEGRSGRWLAQLEETGPLLSETEILFVGHGDPGTTDLLGEQARYIRAFQANVRELARGGAILEDGAKAELTRRMDAVWPGAPLLELVSMSADVIAAELTAT